MVTDSDKRRVLVVGATGHVGREVVAAARAEGAAVRALARDPRLAGLPADVDLARGDLTSMESVESALIGVDAVFLVWPFPTARAAPPVVDAIARHAERVVYLSSLGGRFGADGRPGPVAFHAEVEDLLRRSPAQWTLLRPTGFATNALLWAPQIRAGDVVRWPYAAARRSLIHERDIAAVAVRALLDDGHAGKVYELSGPRAVRQDEQVALIGAALGRPLRLAELTRPDARAHLAAEWGDTPFVDGALDAWAEFVDAPEPVTGTVRDITGAPARGFATWASDHAADFR
jgi:uncharacterized protein YbjT (DUF2867 family)